MVMLRRLKAHPQGAPAALTNLHILLLDDSPAARAETRHALTEVGITKVSDGSADEQDLAGRQFSSQIDVILSELDLRAGSGLAVLKAIRLGRIRGLRPDLCFIFLTAFAEAKFVRAAAHLDANGYLTKPATPEQLRAALLRGHSRACVVDIAKYRNFELGELALH